MTAEITLRSSANGGVNRPLTIDEMDDNFTNLKTEAEKKLDASIYTASDILTKLKTVDVDDGGLNASTLKGLVPSASNTNSTIVARDASGNFAANTITGNLIGNVTGNVAGNLIANDSSVSFNSVSKVFTGSLTGTANNALNLANIPASSYAQLSSPSFTGTPVTPTAAAGTNTTQIASTEFVKTAVTNAINLLGTISTQNSNTVNITGGTISGTTINTHIVGSNSTGNKTIQPVGVGVPSNSLGVDGDIIYQY